MRFSASSMDIPDALAQARDDGRVVFIAGAGVSMGPAGLPGFNGLTSAVLDDLGFGENSPARRLHSLPVRLGDANLSPNEIAMSHAPDRVFAHMETEIDRHQILNQVQRHLAVTDATDRSAHDIVRTLATDQDGRLRLVTTNFDPLFEREGTNIFRPDNLPNLVRDPFFDGLVYLHGRLSEPLRRGERDDIVLSSNDFGRAYLMEAHATRFLLELIRRHVVVFIGYQANDPPVRYLLEAINRFEAIPPNLYAFTPDDEELKSAWREKGVTSIGYATQGNDHSALWDGLELWADRAREPRAWMERTARLAQSSPETLEPWQRSLVVHLTKSADGMGHFCRQEPAPPADWIRVFDSNERYREPRRSLVDDGELPRDPFALYHLAEDKLPIERDRNLPGQSRLPDGVVDILQTTDDDAIAGGLASTSTLRGAYRSGANAILCPRLNLLGRWIVAQVDSPVLVDWLCRQNAIHPEILSTLRWQVWRREADDNADWQDAWFTLLDALSFQLAEEDRMDARSHRSTATPHAIRRLADKHKPRITVSAWIHEQRTDVVETIRSNLEIEYTDAVCSLNFPEGSEGERASLLHGYLMRADALLRFLGRGYGFLVPSIRPEDDTNIDRFGRSSDLGLLLLSYTQSLLDWSEVAPTAARVHVQDWPVDREFLFGRLWCWSIGEPTLLNAEIASSVLTSFSETRFWEARNRRDLLTSLALRRRELSPEACSHVEALLISGPPTEEDSEHRDLYRSWQRLQTAQFLIDADWTFEADMNALMAEWRIDAPEWTPANASDAASSLEGRSGYVTSDLDYSALEGLALADIVPRALELTGRHHDFEESQPWEGLCREEPKRAFFALRAADAASSRTDWAWRVFLNAFEGVEIQVRFHRVVLRALSEKRPQELHEARYAILSWMDRNAPGLLALDEVRFDRLLDRLVSVAREDEAPADYDPDTDARHMHAINSFAGRFTERLLRDPRMTSSDAIPEEVSARLEQMLTLEGRGLDMVICIFGEYVAFIHHRLPDLFSPLEALVLAPREGRLWQAFWSGFGYLAYNLGFDAFRVLKPYLLDRLESNSDEEAVRQETATLITMWLDIHGDLAPEVSDQELQTLLLNGTDAFRRRVVRTLWRWSQSPENGAAILEETERLISQIWPLQRSIRTPELSNALIELALESVNHFDALAEGVLDRIVVGIHADRQSLPGTTETGRQLLRERGPRVINFVEQILDGVPPNYSYYLARFLEAAESEDPSVTSLPSFNRLQALLPPTF